MHLRGCHSSRLPPGLASNVAGDLEINCHEVRGLDLPATGIWPGDLGLPDGLLAEEYLSRLPPGLESLCLCGGGSGAGNPMDGELELGDAPGLTAPEVEVILDEMAADIRTAARAMPGSVSGADVVWAEARAAAMQRTLDEAQAEIARLRAPREGG